MRILGIESSCDETGIAIFDSQHGLIANKVHSQIDTHQSFGGVVPELASRDHVKYLLPLLDTALKEADLKKTMLDGIAYTAGPGLIGALLVGACVAKSLAFGLAIPALAVHHLEAHLLAAKLETASLDFPFLGLLVSGGHTQLVEARTLGHYRTLGETMDDAVGEAFDKVAKLMGLPYPGGPILARLADSSSEKPFFLPPFPRPMTDKPGLDFSFSGLKTHTLTVWNASHQDRESQIAIAQAFQEAVVDTLVIKCRRAIKQTGLVKLVVAGGVAANSAIRKALKQLMDECQGQVYFPSPAYCMDNGAMVAYAGYLHFLQGKQDGNHVIRVNARWPLC